MLELFVKLQNAAQVKGERGQSMAEYAVILGVITVAVIAVIGLLGGNIKTALSTVATSI